MRQSILIFCLLFCLAFSDVMAQPTAVMEADGSTSFCVSGKVKLKIKFTGTAPFGFSIFRSGIGSIVYDTPIFTEQFDSEGWYHFEVNISESSTFSISRIWDSTTTPWNNTTGVIITGQSVDVSVFSMPNPSIGTYSPACGFSIPLNALPDPVSTTYHWEAAEGTFTDATISNAVFTTPNQTEGAFPLTFIQQNGACTTTKSVNVTLRATPKSELSGSQSVCLVSGSTYQMDANVSLTGHAPFSYDISDGIKTYSQSNQPIGSLVTKVPATAHNQTYTITRVTDVNGCEAIAADKSGIATVTDLSPTANAGADILKCGKETIVSGTLNKGIGSWGFVSNQVGAIIEDPMQLQTSLTAASYGWVELKLTVDNNGCKHFDNIRVHFAEPPTVSLVNNSSTICQGQSASMELLLNGQAPWTIDYSANEVPVSTVLTQSPASLMLSPSETTSYVINHITSDDGCELDKDDAYSVIVEPLEPAFAGDDQVLDRIYATQISASPLTLAGYWEVNNSKVQLSDLNNPLALASNLVVGKNVFKWTTLATACPSTSDEVEITVNQYSSYNGFSPNGDGINDLFEIDGLNDLLNAELTVFDSKGKLVYSKKNYDNSWQGEGADGQPLPDGIYYYEFKSDQHESIRDYVVIRRKKDASSNQ